MPRILSSNALVLLKNSSTVGSDGLLYRAACGVGGCLMMALRRGGDKSKSPHRNPAIEYFKVHFDGLFLGYIFRILALLHLFSRLLWLRYFRGYEPEVVVCGGAELALIAQIVFRKARWKYFLFSDIPGHLKPNGLAANTAGGILKYLFVKSWKVGVTSPGFIEAYLKGFGFSSMDSVVVHNIPDYKAWPRVLGDYKFSELSVTIVWAGLLRCSKSADILAEFSQSGPYTPAVRMAGPTFFEHLEGWNFLREQSNVRVWSSYKEFDIPGIYQGSDYVWCCDWSLGVNSASLLPNRLYHAIFNGIPVIASANTFIGEIISSADIGFVIEPSALDLNERLREITGIQHEAWVANLQRIATLLKAQGSSWEKILSGSLSHGDLCVHEDPLVGVNRQIIS